VNYVIDIRMESKQVVIDLGRVEAVRVGADHNQSRVDTICGYRVPASEFFISIIGEARKDPELLEMVRALVQPPVWPPEDRQ
jgi:hypothetical protein